MDSHPVLPTVAVLKTTFPSLRACSREPAGSWRLRRVEIHQIFRKRAGGGGEMLRNKRSDISPERQVCCGCGVDREERFPGTGYGA